MYFPILFEVTWFKCNNSLVLSSYVFEILKLAKLLLSLFIFIFLCLLQKFEMVDNV